MENGIKKLNKDGEKLGDEEIQDIAQHLNVKFEGVSEMETRLKQYDSYLLNLTALGNEAL